MIENLKKRVEQQFGEAIGNVKSCQSLSASIFDRCGARISDSTIRRIWGMLPSPKLPSKSTLDLLSQFIGYRTWDDFCFHTEGNLLLKNTSRSAQVLWDLGKSNAERMSLNTASVIFKKSGVEVNEVVCRQFVDDHISALINSDYMATGLIAPGGYGKSLGVASWVARSIKRKLYDDSIILFLAGGQIDDSYHYSMSIDKWISSILFKSVENVFHNPELFHGKLLVLVLDALDEIDSSLSKSATFLSKIVQFISKYSGCKFLKIVVTTRSSVWGRSLVQEILDDKSASSHWMGISNGAFESDATNMPLLNNKEMQEAFNNFINKKAKGKKLLVDQLNYLLRETISHPYMLKLFVSIYNTNALKFQNYNDVIDEFISREIAHTKYADENLDIIGYMLEKQQYGKSLQPVRKNEIKEKYPIHLRKGGNYFAAYEHLLAYSILSEETFANQFKNLIVQVDFSHSNLRDLLITRYLVEENGGITPDLFVKVDREYANSDLRFRLINNMYSIAYSENSFETIKDFFLLPDSISRDKEILKFVLLQFRNDKPILKLLAQEYCKSSFAKYFLIESYFDFDYLNISYYKLLEIILSSSNTTNEKIYSLAGLSVSRAQLLSSDDFFAFSDELKDLRIDDSCSGYSILLWSIWRIYFAYISGDDTLICSLEDSISSAEKLYSRDADPSSLPTVTFYLELLPHLILFRNKALAKKILDYMGNQPQKSMMDKDARLSTYFNLYRLDLTCQEDRQFELSPIDAYNLEQQVNSYSMSQSYINRVSGYVVLASSCLQQNDKQKFMNYYHTALEICNNANFKLFEISKLKRLADTLDSFKMHAQAQKFRDYSMTMVSDKNRELYDVV